MALTNKQQAFINEYLIDFNTTQAAIRAGYSEKSAYSVGWETLRKPEVELAIQKRLQEKAMSADEVLMRIADQARGSMADFIVFDNEGRASIDLEHAPLHIIKKITLNKVTKLTEDGELITDYKHYVELYDAQSALQLLAKHHGLLTDKTEHTGAIDINVSASDEIASRIDSISQRIRATETD